MREITQFVMRIPLSPTSSCQTLWIFPENQEPEGVYVSRMKKSLISHISRLRWLMPLNHLRGIAKIGGMKGLLALRGFSPQ
jgi:hypothetical protein